MSFDYQRYLASREWALLRHQVLELADGTCQRCLGSGIRLVVHHLTYARIGRERLEDLQAVCGACHRWLSGMSDLDPVVDFLRAEASAPGWEVCAAGNLRLVAIWEAQTPRPDCIRWLFELEATA